MKLTYLGHAGIRADGPGFSLAMDPWLSGQGAFFGAWFPFPSNEHLDAADAVNCQWIGISHEHLDHLDTGALALIPSSATVLIPSYPSGALRRRLARAGVFNVREVDAWERVELGDRNAWMTFIPEKSPMCHDAAMLVVAGGVAILNCNDARLTVAQARRAAIEAGGSLDVVFVQTSGASWHPLCYEYPADVRRAIEAQKRTGKLRAVSQLARAVRPRLLVPFAGPPCFLDPKLAHLNQSIPEPGFFPDQAQAAVWLSQHLSEQAVRHLMPGDTYDVANQQYAADEHWNGFDYHDWTAVEGYLDSYRDRRRPALTAAYAACPEPADDLGPRFADHIARLGELSPWFVERIGMTVRFAVEGPGGGRWDAHFENGAARVDLKGRAATVPYRIRVESRWLAPVVEGEAGWEDLLLSMRLSAYREPDTYNDYLVGLLKHADASALAAVERWETTTARRAEETLEVEVDGRRYQISRFCPHAGEDLATGAMVADGVIRCLGHNYEFDLQTGTCLNARCQPLRSRPVSAAPAPDEVSAVPTPDEPMALCLRT